MEEAIPSSSVAAYEPVGVVKFYELVEVLGVLREIAPGINGSYPIVYVKSSWCA